MRTTKRVAKPSAAPAIIRGTYKYRVTLKHPKTGAVIRHWNTDKESAYIDADMLMSPSVSVDVTRVRMVGTRFS